MNTTKSTSPEKRDHPLHYLQRTCFSNCVIQSAYQDGKIWAIEPDDTINHGIAREDGRLSDELIDQCMIAARPCTKGYAHIRNLYAPNRVKYPMKR